jgi:transposase
MLQRGGQIVIRMLHNVRQKTIEPPLRKTILPGTLIRTDEYCIYSRLPLGGYQPKTVCHTRGEHARDDDAGRYTSLT